MKIIIFAFTFFALFSCKKDWDCECTYVDGNSETITNSIIEGKTKTEAKSDCNTTGSSANFSYSCVLKGSK